MRLAKSTRLVPHDQYYSYFVFMCIVSHVVYIGGEVHNEDEDRITAAHGVVTASMRNGVVL